MSETTINASDKSDYSVWFEENPHKELQDFIEISEKNFEAFEDNNQQLSSLFRKGVDWNEFRQLSEKYELLTKEINTCLEIEKIVAKEEIEDCKRRLPVVENDIEALNTRIHEGVIKVNEMQREKSNTQEKVVSKHSSFQQAIKYYKSRFNVYVHLAKADNVHKVQICFFTQKFDDTYSATLLLYGEGSKKWKLENVKPAMNKSIVAQLQHRLEETNDINEILCAIRRHLEYNMK